MNHDFPTIEEVVAIHDEAVHEFGGSLGLRDMGALASAVMRPQIGYYDTLIEEAAALMESLAMNHPFIDGNKRTAFYTTDAFLRRNGSFIDCDNDEDPPLLHAALRDQLVQIRRAPRMAGGTRQAPAGDLTPWPVRKAMPDHRTEDTMTTVTEIQQAIMNLPKSDYAQLRNWPFDYALHELDRVRRRYKGRQAVRRGTLKVAFRPIHFHSRGSHPF